MISVWARAIVLLFPVIVLAQPSYSELLADAVKLIQNSRFQDALAPLETALKLQPRAFEPNYLSGVTLSELGRNRAAIEHLRIAQSARPEHTGALTLLGVLYLKEDYPLDAAEALEAANNAAPLSEKAGLLLAQAWHRSFAFDRSLRVAGALVERFPASPDAQFRLGFELETAGRFDEALLRFRRAISLRPNFMEAHFAAGRIEYRLGQNEQAETDLRIALGRTPTNRQLRLEMGKVLMVLSRDADARPLLESLIREYEQEPLPHLLLARLFERMGDKPAAQHERARFLELSRTTDTSGGMGSSIPSRQLRRFPDN